MTEVTWTSLAMGFFTSLCVAFFVITAQIVMRAWQLLQQLQMTTGNLVSLTPYETGYKKNEQYLERIISNTSIYFFSANHWPVWIRLPYFLIYEFVGIFWTNCMWIVTMPAPKEFNESEFGNYGNKKEIFALRLHRVACDLKNSQKYEEFSKQLSEYINQKVWKRIHTFLKEYCCLLIILCIIICFAILFFLFKA